jgi:hypothetical protein
MAAVYDTHKLRTRVTESCVCDVWGLLVIFAGADIARRCGHERRRAWSVSGCTQQSYDKHIRIAGDSTEI